MRLIRLIVLLAFCLSFTACTKDSSDDGSSSNNSDTARSFCDSNNRITNGQICSDSSRSPVVLLALADSSGELTSLCSGSLITPSYVLTAAHCLDKRLGVSEVFVDENGQFDFIPAVEVHIHPNWVRIPGDPNDVGIVKLERPINGRDIAPLLLSKNINPGDMVDIYGYGLDENDESGILRQGRMKIDLIDTKGNLLAKYDDTGMNICSGDSGGPVAAPGNSGLGILGVNSAGSAFGCTEGSQALFVGVQGGANLDFITSIVPQIRTS